MKKNSDLFFLFFFALRAWAWSLKKAQSARAFCLFSRTFKSHAKAFCLVKFKAKCAKCVLALSNAPQKRPLNANLAQFMAKIHSFLFKVYFEREFCLEKFKTKRPFIANFSLNSTQIFVNSAKFLLNFAYNFTYKFTF